MEYGFLIDQRKCIGCHACTVACKSENEVPVGDFRTWVKYVEKGSFPSVRRHFTVLRCNHCDAAPCVEICPVEALHKRPDAIVDLDRDLCIGCQACMQACPYDALYLNESSGTAEKCHYCAHRTELGLEPACVVVCPEEAIVSGDVSNPDSRIAQMIDTLPTAQRKLEKGTKPRVWYVDALEEALVPGSAQEPKEWLWSNRRVQPSAETAGQPAEDVVTTLNVDHPPVWGWHIWTYLTTKNIAAGAGMAAAVGALLQPELSGLWLELVALLFLGLTSWLLVDDLGRPERFLKILTHANPRSWLVRGTWVLMAFGGLATLALGALLLDQPNLAIGLRLLNFPAAVLAAGYSAWLFGQCKGRDLWLESGLFTGLVARAGWCGAGLLMLASGTAPASATVSWIFVGAALLNAFLFWHEAVRGLSTPDAERARKAMTAGGALHAVAGMALLTGLIAGALVLGVDTEVKSFGLGSFASLVGRGFCCLTILFALFAYERLWVRAGQAVPIS